MGKDSKEKIPKIKTVDSNKKPPIEKAKIKDDRWPRWEEDGVVDTKEFEKIYGDLIDRISGAIDNLPQELLSKYSSRQIIQMIKDIYMFHKADLKTQSYEPINEEKFDKTMIIKSFEENANFKFNETTGVIISALEYIQNKYFNTKPKEKPKIANISKDEITGKITFSDKPKELKDVPRSSLHEDRFYSEIITKSFAPDDIRDHMVKLWDGYINTNEPIARQRKYQEFMLEYSRYIKSLSKVLKVFFEDKPKLDTDEEKAIYNNLKQIFENKITLTSLIEKYKQAQSDQFFVDNLEKMAKRKDKDADLENTFSSQNMVLEALKYIERIDVTPPPLSSTLKSYQLKEYPEGKEGVKPEPNPEPEPKPDPNPNPDPIPEPKPTTPKVEGKITLKAAVIAYDKATVKAFSRDIADRKESNSYQETKPMGLWQRFKNGAKRIWTHNLWRDYYRQKNIHQAEQDIVSQRNLFVDEDLTGSVQEGINRDVMLRLTNVEDIQNAIQAGEKAELLTDTVMKDRVLGVIKQYAFDGTLTDDEFIVEQNNIVQDIKQANPDIFDDVAIDANNLLEIARGLKAKYTHTKGIKNLDIDIDIVIASMKAGARTEKRQTTVERLAEKMANTRLGKFVNETTLASAMSICYGIINSVGSLFLYNKAADIGSFGATALLSGTLGAIRKRNVLEDQRRQFMRDQATNRNIDLNDKKVRDLERYKYQSIKAADAINNAQTMLSRFNDPALKASLTEADIRNTINALVETSAHMELSAEQSIDLITYSNSQAVEHERTHMVLANDQLKKQLRDIIVDRNIDLGGLTPDAYLKLNIRNKKDQLLSNPDGVNMQNKRFASYKNKAGFKTFLHSAVTGLVIGATFQETMAALNPQQQGLFESWVGHIDKNPKSQTALKNLADFISNKYAARTGHLISQAEAFNIEKRPGKIELNNNQELRLDKQGNYDLYQDGKLTEENLVAFRNGKLVDNVQEWKDHGLLIENQTINAGAEEQIKSLVSAKQFAEANPDMVSVAGKRVWIRNQTTGIYDRNELGISFEVSSSGDPVIDISNMTRSGSFDFGKNIDVIEAIKSGKANILGSISKDSAGRVFEIPLNGTKLVIGENSPLRQFFNIVNGKVIYNGGAIEVAVKEGTTRNILATATGENIINNIPIFSKAPHMFDQVTIHTIPDTLKNLPYRMPPFIPIRGEKPLPYKKAEKAKDKTAIEPAPYQPDWVIVKENQTQAQGEDKDIDEGNKKAIAGKEKDTDKKDDKKNKPAPGSVAKPGSNKPQAKKEKGSGDVAKTKENKDTIENRKKLYGWEASFELAKLAKKEGVDLTKLTREEYANYAIKNSLKIGVEQLRMASWERALLSWDEHTQEIAKHKNQLIGSKEDSDFKQFSQVTMALAKSKNESDRKAEDNIYVQPLTAKSSAWLYFKINQGFDYQLNNTPKSYVTVKDIKLLTPDVFSSLMTKLRDQKLNCDIKIFQRLADQGQFLNDQIVIRGNTEKDVKQALKIAQNILGTNFLQGDIGFDSNGKSHSEILADKIKSDVGK